MSSYIVEIGIKSGEGQFTQWASDGFYAGYEPNGGPMRVVVSGEAIFRFATYELANRIPSGDPRLTGRHRIVQVPEEPNV